MVYYRGDKILVQMPLLASDGIFTVQGKETVWGAILKNFKYIFKNI